MRRLLTLALAGVAACVIDSPARATHVGLSTTDLGGGRFQYELIVDNSRGIDAVAGLSVLDAGSVYGVDGGTVIGSPAGWDYLPPDPPNGVDALDFFSLDPSGDVAVGAALGGYTFESTTDPGTTGGGPIVEAFSAAGETVFLGHAGFPFGSLGVTYLATALGGGNFEYAFTIENLAGILPVEGFSILNAASALGLDVGSVVGLPSGWDFLDPDPMNGVDALDFFALDPDAAVAVGGSLGGFRVFSTTAPGSIGPGGIAVELIGTNSQGVFRGQALLVPEPSSIALTAIALAGLGVVATRRRRAARH